ncbi:MAG: hypothetical protein U9Q06_02790 [Nanoarchaeota archaeon]|nr:hypothetical protein [Nanoarchaeota archaeon]
MPVTKDKIRIKTFIIEHVLAISITNHVKFREIFNGRYLSDAIRSAHTSAGEGIYYACKFYEPVYSRVRVIKQLEDRTKIGPWHEINFEEEENLENFKGKRNRLELLEPNDKDFDESIDLFDPLTPSKY